MHASTYCFEMACQVLRCLNCTVSLACKLAQSSSRATLGTATAKPPHIRRTCPTASMRVERQHPLPPLACSPDLRNACHRSWMSWSHPTPLSVRCTAIVTVVGVVARTATANVSPQHGSSTSARASTGAAPSCAWWARLRVCETMAMLLLLGPTGMVTAGKQASKQGAAEC